MGATLLWRLKGDPQAVAPEKLTAGLRHHLQSDDLTTVVMQIGTIQQSYVLLPVCEGCALGGCALGCRASLLRRVLRSSGGEQCVLRAFPQGLRRRPYTRAVLAWPTRNAQPLTNTLLAAWPEARLSLHWRQRLLRKHITVAALLLVGADGPAPAPALRAAGWSTLPLPDVRGQLARLLTRPVPSAALAILGRTWSGDPWLAAPTPENLLTSTEETQWTTRTETDPLLSDQEWNEPPVIDLARTIEP